MSLKLLHVYKRFGIDGTSNFQEALKDVSLEIEKGEMLAIKGRSGAGKSTLLHIIGLLDTVDEGSYDFDGMAVEGLDNGEAARLRNTKIGFVLQDFGLIEDDTVLYNVCLPLMFGSTPYKKIKQIAADNLDQVGIGSLAGKKVAVLSGGEKQRVAIARALVNGSDYILADEPTGALDTDNAVKIINIMQELHREGKTIVIVTHDDAVANACGRVICMEDGRIS